MLRAEEAHPVDALGQYIPAPDNALRPGRAGLVNNRSIAWFKKGDVIQTDVGAATVESVNCKTNSYMVAIGGNSARMLISFERAWARNEEAIRARHAGPKPGLLGRLKNFILRL